MAEKEKLNRQTMCDRLAMEFQDGWIVNLGVGMPTLCSNYKDESRELIYHSENGVIGYGPIAEERDFYVFPYDMRHCVYPHANPNAVRRTLAANMDVEYNPVGTRTAG